MAFLKAVFWLLSLPLKLISKPATVLRKMSLHSPEQKPAAPEQGLWPEYEYGGEKFPPFVGPLGDLRLKPINCGNDGRDRIFGDPGFWKDPKTNKWRLNKRYFSRNFKLFDLPYVGKRWIHKSFGPYLREGLRRAQEACPTYRPKKIGIINVRRMRSPGPLPRPWSAHSWGIAADISGEDGAFRRRDTIPPEWIEAMESVGLVHGRRFKGFRDDMHWQVYW